MGSAVVGDQRPLDGAPAARLRQVHTAMAGSGWVIRAYRPPGWVLPLVASEVESGP